MRRHCRYFLSFRKCQAPFEAEDWWLMVGRARRQRLCAEGSVREGGRRHLGIIFGAYCSDVVRSLRFSTRQDVQYKRERAAKSKFYKTGRLQ